MKTFTDYLTLTTRERKEIVNITAGVYVNEEETGLKKDILKWLEHLAPVADYEHHRTGEDDGDAHLKRILVNHQVILPITKGRLDFGPWEQVFYAEFDGQGKKRVILKAQGI